MRNIPLGAEVPIVFQKEQSPLFRVLTEHFWRNVFHKNDRRNITFRAEYFV